MEFREFIDRLSLGEFYCADDSRRDDGGSDLHEGVPREYYFFILDLLFIHQFGQNL